MPFFTGIGDLPGGIFFSVAQEVSAHGVVLVGDSARGGAASHEGVRWTLADGMSPLGTGTSNAFGVSGRGTVIVGSFVIPDYSIEAFMWTKATGMVPMGDLPGGEFRSAAKCVSSCGRIIVGSGKSDKGSEAFRWTAETGMAGLGDLEGGDFSSGASSISPDGLVIVGSSISHNGTEAYRWTTATGMIGLGALGGSWFYSVARDASADGAVVVGSSMAPGGEMSFRWTAETGMVGLGRYHPDELGNRAYGVSWDGNVIVGEVGILDDNGNGAYIWTPETGMRRLTDVLAELGVTIPPGWYLLAAYGVSADGRTIVGAGINPAGHSEGWVAYLGPTCRADFNKDGAVTSQDFFDYLNAWADGSIFSDWNYDGVINTLDFLAFLNDYARGCP
ncbi:MAG TPA: GC-type dockerin domain-anchored protein [Phycisphaerales bacterium]|nr:GC-type dockerin domain-anchored protein [Phycisphaerales bacterium]